MKNLKHILVTIYLILAILLTLTLLAYNEFKITEIGPYSFLIIKNDELAPEFNDGDLVIVNKNDEIHTGRKVFFYDTSNEKIEVKLATVQKAERVTEDEVTYTLEGERKISSEYVLGAANKAEIIPTVGKVMGIFQSKWGFLFLIVFPALILVINEIGVVFKNVVEVIQEAKQETKKEEQEESSSKESDKDEK